LIFEISDTPLKASQYMLKAMVVCLPFIILQLAAGVNPGSFAIHSHHSKAGNYDQVWHMTGSIEKPLISARQPAAEVMDPRKGQPIWMHLHIPKTGGTTLSNMLICDFCNEKQCESLELGWGSHCSRPCAAAFIDTEMHCMKLMRSSTAIDMRREHASFTTQRERAEALARTFHATGVVYLTLLRGGADRTISHWAHEMSMMPENIVVNGTLVNRYAEESLRWYVSNSWQNRSRWANFRNNMQVAMLASVPDSTLVTRDHLEKAKSVLLKEERRWLVGFTYCIARYRRHLRELREGNVSDLEINASFLQQDIVRHDVYDEVLRDQQEFPKLEHRTPAGLVLSNEVVEWVERENSLDTELYHWAMMREDKARFIGAGEFSCWRAHRKISWYVTPKSFLDGRSEMERADANFTGNLTVGMEEGDYDEGAEEEDPELVDVDVFTVPEDGVEA